MESKARCIFHKPFGLMNNTFKLHILESTYTNRNTHVKSQLEVRQIVDFDLINRELKNYEPKFGTGILKVIFNLLPQKNSRLDEVCKQWRLTCESIYLIENARLNYLTFCKNNFLSNKMIFTINIRINNIICRFRNIIFGWNNDICSINKIRDLCSRFQAITKHDKNNSSLLNNDNYLIRVVELINFQNEYGFKFDSNSEIKRIHVGICLYNDLKSSCEEASKIEDISTLENEIIMSYFIRLINFDYTVRDEPLFQRLKSPLKDLICNHKALEDLRSIPTKNKTSGQWDKILELDPAISANDLRSAAECFLTSGNNKRAAECRIQILSEGSGDNRLQDLRVASIACARAGFKFEVLNFNEEILRIAGVNANEIDFRNTAIGCKNSGLYMEALGYWLKYLEFFILGPKPEDLDPILFAFNEAGFRPVSKDQTSLDIKCFDACEQKLRDLAIICKRLGLKKRFADCWTQIVRKKGANATLDEIRHTILACQEAKLYKKTVKYMDLLIKKSGKEVLESDLRKYAKACELVDFKKAYYAQKEVLKMVGMAATPYDIRQMAMLSTFAGFDLKSIKYYEYLINNWIETVTTNDYMTLAIIYKKIGREIKSLECLKKRFQKLGTNATVNDLRYMAATFEEAGLDSKAIKFYEQLINMSDEYPSNIDLFELARLYEKMKFYEKAFKCREKAHATYINTWGIGISNYL